MKKTLMASLLASSLVAVPTPALAAAPSAEVALAQCDIELPNDKWEYVLGTVTLASSSTTEGSREFLGNITGPSGSSDTYHGDVRITPGQTEEIWSIECRALNPQDKYNYDHSYYATYRVVFGGGDAVVEKVAICNHGHGTSPVPGSGYTGTCPPL